VWFGLLGPLRVLGDTGDALQVTGARQRVLLAALLMRPRLIVSGEDLANMIWDGEPPARAPVTLRSQVKRLRQGLGAEAGARIVTRPAGYSIEVGDEELDVRRFADLCARGTSAARAAAWDRASRILSEALALWRGPPLVDIRSEILRSEEVPYLEELRLEALESRIEADLVAGRLDGMVIELRRLTAAHPLRERFWYQLMRVLEECGRPVEALVVYARARQVISEELGADPGPDLQQLHQRILIGDPAPAAQPPAGGPKPATVAAATAVPRQLPAAARHFVGRTRELQRLSEFLDEDSGAAGAVVISAIGGTAGVGKTALAVRWAHQVARRFPDGQLYVNLRGYDPGLAMSAADALAAFLRALGVPGQDIPAEADERAARYRGLLATRRVLVVLDNASEVEQVRPLLPGTPTCVVVVTSRDSLAGLVARDGAQRVELDLLSLADAVGLLHSLVGARADADPAAAAALALQCARLPLALRVAAELAAARPAVPLAGLAAELADHQRRLDLLGAGGDQRTAVRAVFSWSYRHLDADVRRTFRLLGLHPGPDFDHYAVAGLTGCSVSEAGRLLGPLTQAGLVQVTSLGRYGMHDLLRAYAAEQAGAVDGEEERRAALARLFDYYLHATAVAMDALGLADDRGRPAAASAILAPAMTGQAAARAWLDAELATLVAVAVHTAGHGWIGHATRLTATLFRYLDGSHNLAALTIYTHARAAARRYGDRVGEVTALINLGLVSARQGCGPDATIQFQEALALAREARDRAGEARAVANLGDINFQQGHYRQASDLYAQAVGLCREIGDLAGVAYALENLGWSDQRLGHYEQSAGHFQEALPLFRAAGDTAGVAHTLRGLGDLCQRKGRYPQAAGYHQQALTLFRRIGDRLGQAQSLTALGDADRGQGRYQRAVGHQQHALALARQISDRSGEASALNGFGEALLAIGELGRARQQHAAALSLASQVSDQYQLARAHCGLARAQHAAGDTGQAEQHWRQALTLYAGLGAPEAARVRALLHRSGNRAPGSTGPRQSRLALHDRVERAAGVACIASAVTRNDLADPLARGWERSALFNLRTRGQ
jgi:DNA-binding SARP family transcriptional activator/Tfp pilus assembly protein PilF